jgi:hypothetical protein
MYASISNLKKVLVQSPLLKSADAAEIANAAQRSGITVSAGEIAKFVSESGVRELRSADLAAIVGGPAPHAGTMHEVLHVSVDHLDDLVVQKTKSEC